MSYCGIPSMTNAHSQETELPLTTTCLACRINDSITVWQLRRYLPSTVLSRWRKRRSVSDQFSTIVVASRARGIGLVCTGDSRFAPSQWETALLCNDVSHWLGASIESVPWADRLFRILSHPNQAVRHIDMQWHWLCLRFHLPKEQKCVQQLLCKRIFFISNNMTVAPGNARNTLFVRLVFSCFCYL